MNNFDSTQIRDIVFQAFKRSAINFDPDKIYDWQIEAIESCIRNETTLVAIPTGGGKTLVFQLAPVVLSIIAKKPQFVLIISPLLALIKNQSQMFHEEKCIRLEKNLNFSKLTRDILGGEIEYGTVLYTSFQFIIFLKELFRVVSFSILFFSV